MPRPVIPDNWPNHVVYQKLRKYLTSDMAAKLNEVDVAGHSYTDSLALKWAIVETEPDSDTRYGGAIWVTYQ